MARAAILYQPIDSFNVQPEATIQRTYQPNPDEFFTNLPEFQNSNRFNQPEHDDFDLYSLQMTGSLPRRDAHLPDRLRGPSHRFLSVIFHCLSEC